MKRIACAIDLCSQMRLKHSIFRTAATALLTVAIPGAGMAADQHVVSIAELRQQMVSAGQTRAANLQKTEALLSSPPVEKILRDAKIEPQQMQTAVAGLSDDELARLASRADKIQNDITAGALSNQELTYIVIALATAVIILVIVRP